MMRVRSLFLLLISFAFLAGCNSQMLLMDDEYNPPVFWGTHSVESGENISSIAWRYNRDFRELASANGIKPPYTLKIDQKIRLDLKGDPNAYTGDLDNNSNIIAPGPVATGKKPAPSPVKPLPQKFAEMDSGLARVRDGIEWQWPVAGDVLEGISFGKIRNKGLNIAGEEGDPVRSAAKGRVIYAGSGVVGFGNLLIVEHAPGMLSAYAHNRSLFVGLGDYVQRGDVVAEMGKVGTNKVKLHFEIRKQGKPKDPLDYLPTKQG